MDFAQSHREIPMGDMGPPPLATLRVPTPAMVCEQHVVSSSSYTL
jgi:hypothetical protein